MVNGEWLRASLLTIDHLLFTFFSPLNQHAAPSDAAAERGEQHEVAFVNHSLLDALVERDWDGGRRGVAVVRDVRVNDCGVNVETRRDALRDALVRLMR